MNQNEIEKRYFEILDLGLKAQVQGSAMLKVKERWKDVVRMSALLSANEVAMKLGVSERSFWNFLKAINVNYSEMQAISKAYQDLQKLTREEKLKAKEEIAKILPDKWSAFKELEVIKAFIKYVTSRREAKEAVAKGYVGKLFRICKDLGKHPETLTKEDLEKWLEDFRSQLGDLGREPEYAQAFSELVKICRVFAEFRGYTITFKTKEYKGQWSIYFDKEARRRLAEMASEELRAIMEFYFYTGMRRKAILRIENIKTNGNYVTFEVKEKGKRETYTWKKRVSKELWERVKKYLPRTEKDLETIEKELIKLYAKFFGIDKDLLRRIKEATLFGYRMVRIGDQEIIMETPKISDILAELRQRGYENEKLIYYALRHPLHVWRHTFAMSALKATGYNYEIVAKIGGWVKVDTLRYVYGQLEYEDAWAIFEGKYQPEPFTFT